MKVRYARYERRIWQERKSKLRTKLAKAGCVERLDEVIAAVWGWNARFKLAQRLRYETKHKGTKL